LSELLLVLVLVSITALATAVAAAAATRVYMQPGSGHPTTKFVVRFRSPDQTGSLGSIRRQDVLSATGPSGGTGCVSSISIDLSRTAKGRRVRVTLSPRRFGHVWCVGRFRGRITETETIICLPTRACPQIEILPRIVARFSFRVKPARTRSPGGGGEQTAGPSFAGLQTAVTCIVLTPPPRALAREPAYVLSWPPATDPVTPSSAIVYEIFYSATAGEEDYSQPTWTTDPGASGFTTPGVPAGPAFFVVRARDQAGLEDQNTVQREGVSDCA
jgi:hypothetical protein